MNEKKYEGTVVLSNVISTKEAAEMVNNAIKNNLDRYKSYGVTVRNSDNYVIEVEQAGEAIIVSVELQYETDNENNIDMDCLILGGEI